VCVIPWALPKAGNEAAPLALSDVRRVDGARGRILYAEALRFSDL
jgi:hypothetical protein